jgi:hypothetical protein
MICADFLAGANLDAEDPTVLLQSTSRFFEFLPGEEQQGISAASDSEDHVTGCYPNNHACGWIPSCTNNSESRCCGETAGDASLAAADRTWRFTTGNFAARADMI